MSEPDFRKMGDPLNDRLPPRDPVRYSDEARRRWLGSPNLRGDLHEGGAMQVTSQFLETLTDALDKAIAHPMSLDDAIEVMEYVQEHTRGVLGGLYHDQRQERGGDA